MNQFWNWIYNAETESDELEIKGVIAEESWWDDEISPKKFKAELDKYRGKNITVVISSPGGDVFAASQIYTMLMDHTGQVTVKIDGYAMSAASVIAMAGGRVIMSPTAIMMVHNPWSFAWGDARDMEHMADVLGEVKESIINAYEIKTGMSRVKLSHLMDDETYMSAKKALELGFIDEIMYHQDNSAAGQSAQAYSFSRMAVYNSLMDKIAPSRVRNNPTSDPAPEPTQGPTSAAKIIGVLPELYALKIKLNWRNY